MPVSKLIVYFLGSVFNKNLDQKDNWKGSWPDWKWKSTTYLCEWMELRRKEEGAENLWRIGNNLYDLESWSSKHPGGANWITLTKGTDITEAFESHHLSEYPETLLPKFFVREATSPRNSPFTFNEDGLYKALKKRVADYLKTHQTNQFKSDILTDFLLVTTLITSILASIYKNYSLCILSGITLGFLAICGHNYFHKKDNFRMYYFNFSMLSYRDWRLQHVMSHHCYPNSRYDLEITLFDPYLQWFPKNDKTFISKYISWIYSPLAYGLTFHRQYIERLLINPDGYLELMPCIYPFIMVLSGGGLRQSLIMWNVLTIVASLIFVMIGLHAGHHHPEIFHDGDYARDDKDWGLYQLDAVRDRLELKDSLPLVLLSFGDHCMHHLFPTVDHGDLDSLYPTLIQVCEEFGYPLTFSTQIEQVKGQFQQLARTCPRNNIRPLKPPK